MPERAFPRYALAAAVTIRHGAAIEACTRNVSRGGLCVVAPAALPIGAEITVEMMLIFDGDRTSESLVVPARVVWSTALDETFQIGLAFRALSAQQARYLDMFLQFLAAHPREVERRLRASGTDDPFGG